MNIPFRVGQGDEKLESKFVAEAKSQGFDGLAGHRLVDQRSKYQYLWRLISGSFFDNQIGQVLILKRFVQGGFRV